ncbi:MAG: hypothetical protein U1E16_01525 [Hyphomicrobiales bacterium]
MRFLAIDGVTGEEKAIGEPAVIDKLVKVGMPKSAIRFDDAHKRIPVPTETGNLIVDLPATAEGRTCCSPPISTPCRCAAVPKPKMEGRRIVSGSTTALGGDNRTGCGVLVSSPRR